jgi:general secretion pathway protein K
MSMRRSRRDRGIALILVLLVLAVLIAVVGQMAISSLHDRTVAENHLADLQNTAAARSGYHRATLLLRADLEAGQTVDALDETWAIPFDLALERSTVHVEVRDAERAVNLSRIVKDNGEPNAAGVERLRRLCRALRQPPDVAERIIDYVDADVKGEYEARARNARLFNLEELLRIEGLTPEALYGAVVGGEQRKGLLEFLTVWPRTAAESSDGVNVNTAPAEVLQALSDEMTPGAAEAIVAARSRPTADGGTQEFQSPADVKDVAGLSPEAYASIQPYLRVTSATFEIRAKSRGGNVEKAWVYVVSRKGGANGGVSLVASHRANDFLAVRPPDEEPR